MKKLYVSALVLVLLITLFIYSKRLNPIEQIPPPEQTITVTPPAEVNIKSDEPVNIKIKVPTPVPLPVPVPVLPGKVIGTEINYDNVLNGVNKIRYGLGLPILKRSPSLDAIAEARLADMQKYNYFAHTNPTTGKKFYNWYDQPGDFVWSYTDENLARNYNTVQDMLDAWVKSPTHYAVMTRKEVTHTGVAISGSLVVQEFGGVVE